MWYRGNSFVLDPLRSSETLWKYRAYRLSRVLERSAVGNKAFCRKEGSSMARIQFQNFVKHQSVSMRESFGLQSSTTNLSASSFFHHRGNLDCVYNSCTWNLNSKKCTETHKATAYEHETALGNNMWISTQREWNNKQTGFITVLRTPQREGTSWFSTGFSPSLSLTLALKNFAS